MITVLESNRLSVLYFSIRETDENNATEFFYTYYFPLNYVPAEGIAIVTPVLKIILHILDHIRSFPF